MEVKGVKFYHFLWSWGPFLPNIKSCNLFLLMLMFKKDDSFAGFEGPVLGQK